MEMVKGYPFGVELVNGEWKAFRVFGHNKFTLRVDGFATKEQALKYLEHDVNTYKNSIIEAINERVNSWNN